MVLDEDLGDEPMIPGGRGVLDGLDPSAARPEPFRGASMDVHDGAGLPRGELEARELAEQRMHAEPAAVLEASDEQVRALELAEHRRRVVPFQDRLAEVDRELPED